MGKRRKTEAIITNEFHDLPEPIIHLIQSFLTGKEAARTTILSKAWHSAWLTRPNLDFCEGFPRKIHELLEFASMTIQRYEQSNLKIESLSLRRERDSRYYNHQETRDLIVRALKIGATHLSFKDVNIPHEVFEAGNLVELCAEDCTIELETDRKVFCSKLESLSLSKTFISIERICKIISSCPLIKKLSLSRYPTFSDPFEPHELSLTDFLSKFPSIEDLTLNSCKNVREICSPSLKRLTFIPKNNDDEVNLKGIKLDVPNIQKFTFVCINNNRSVVSFKSTPSRQWESHVSFCGSLKTSWFSWLKKFLTKLRRSKSIHLSINLYSCKKNLDYEPGDIHKRRRCQVENVSVDFSRLSSLSCFALFDALFRFCRPKFITQKLHITTGETKTNNDILRKTFVRGMNGEFSHPSSFMHGVHGLEDVNMELYDEDVAAWRPLPLETLLDHGLIKEEQNVRFHLKWKPLSKLA